MDLKIGDEVAVPFTKGRISILQYTGAVIGIMRNLCKIKIIFGSSSRTWVGKTSKILKVSRKKGERNFPIS